MEVIFEFIADSEVIIQLISSGVAGCAVVRLLLEGELLFGVNHAARAFFRLIEERVVALNAGHTGFFPCRMVGVCFGVVAFLEIRHVAPGALGIPYHAASCPMPPVAGATLVLTKHVKPLALACIPGGAGGVIAAVFAGNKILDKGNTSDRHGGCPGFP